MTPRPASDLNQSSAHAVLDLLARLRQVRDTDMAKLLNCHRNSIPMKRNGSSPLQPLELELLARNFDVPVALFAETGLDAASWLIDNRPSWFERDFQPSRQTKRQAELEAKLQDDSAVLRFGSFQGTSREQHWSHFPLAA